MEVFRLGDVKKAFYDHLSLLDKHFIYSDCIDKGISNLLRPFIDSLKEDGALPYLINSDERFRASPLASSIIWLEDAGLLSADVLDVLQDKLIFLKDNCENFDKDNGFIQKKPDDAEAWSYCEGASVWSTSLAVIALLDCNGNGVKKAEKFKGAILWLAEQKKLGDKGWAYQKWDNCSENAIMTSLAIQALTLTLSSQNVDKFNFTEDEKKIVSKSVNLGYDYLKTNIVNKGKYAYWCFENKPSCTATTWALFALKHSTNITNLDKGINSFYKSIGPKCINFILSNIPSKSERWMDEQIVCEGGAKYNKHKNYYSFTPTLLAQLFELGISPYHPKVINQIKWLLNNKSDWKITEYDVEKECTFTYAMTVSVIFKWLTMVGCNAEVLLWESKNINDKLTRFTFGFHSKKTYPERIVLKKKMDFWGTLCITAVFVAFLLPHYIEISGWVAFYLSNILPSSADWHNVYINLISTGLYGALAFLFAKIVGLIRRWILK